MSNLRIESSAQGFSEYNPIPAFPQPDKFTADEMLEEVVRYWGNANAEYMATINFKTAEKLLANSNLGQIAVKVTNIEDPTKVEIEWISFNAVTAQSTSRIDNRNIAKEINQKITNLVNSFFNDGSQTETYFTFGADLMDQFRLAITQSGKSPVSETINARIGQNNEEPFIFLIMGSIGLHLAPGAGGRGSICGAKLPPPKI